jgi:hypothetical protein
LRRTDAPLLKEKSAGNEEATFSSTSTLPPSAGLTSTVSLKLAPAQPASTGLAIDSTAMIGSNNKAQTDNGKVILNSFLAILLYSF